MRVGCDTVWHRGTSCGRTGARARGKRATCTCRRIYLGEVVVCDCLVLYIVTEQ